MTVNAESSFKKLSSIRHKPNLFLVGVPKAGTTSLAINLSSTDSVYLPTIKEPNFFIKNSFTNALHIRKLEQYLNLYKTDKKYKYYCDSSTSYIFDPDVASNIKAFNIKAKVIILLRDPVERAFSHYNMEKNTYRREKLDFLDALRPNNRHDYFGFQVNPYTEPSLYFNQVKRFIDIFNKEDLKVIILEKTENINHEIEEFLNIDSLPTKRYNENKKVKNIFFSYLLKSSLLKNLRKLIGNELKQFVAEKIIFQNIPKEELSHNQKKIIFNEFFREDVLKLEKLLNKDLSIWKF